MYGAHASMARFPEELIALRPCLHNIYYYSFQKYRIQPEAGQSVVASHHPHDITYSVLYNPHSRSIKVGTGLDSRGSLATFSSSSMSDSTFLIAFPHSNKS